MADERRLREELAAHRAALEAEFERQGMLPAAARRAARLKLGGEDQIRESWRAARRWHWLDDLRRDLALAVRALRRSPGFTLVVVLSLALGIGANAAIFSLLHAALYQKLPVRQPSQLALLYWYAHGHPNVSQSGIGGPPGTGGEYSLAYPSYEYLRDHSHRVFQSIFGFAPLGFGAPATALEAHGQTQMAQGALVTGQYFEGLGVAAARGRVLAPADERAGAPEAIVLSYAYWTSRFGRDPAIVGQTVTLAGTPATVVGVAARGFQGVQMGTSYDFWLAASPTTPAVLAPWGYEPADSSVYSTTNYWWMPMMARLRPGVTRAQAVAALGPAFSRFSAAGLTPAPSGDAIPQLGLVDGSQGINAFEGDNGQTLWILMSVVGVLLLLACVNVAALLLARATSRRQEIAVRLALGAGRARLIRQLLAESVLLAVIGGAIGAALAPLGVRALLALLGGAAPVPLAVPLNWAIVGFIAGISLLAGTLFGLAPALRSTRVPIAAVIKSGRAEVGARTRLGGDRALAIGQVALSLVLLAAAGLFLRSLNLQENLPLGFNDHNVILFGLDGSQTGDKGSSLDAFYARVRQRLLALPGVTGVTSSRLALLTGWTSNGGVSVPGVKLTADQSGAYFNAVGPAFLKTMGIPLVAGRDFTPADMASTRRIAIVNEALARQLFGRASPLGREIVHDGPPATIVGIAANARYGSRHGAMPATAYFPFNQGQVPTGAMDFEVRAANHPQAVEAGIRSAIHDLDPALAISAMRLQFDQDQRQMDQPRMFTEVSGFFGLLGLLLAAIGIEGTMAYAVARRRGEIGIRMALGADSGRLLRGVLRETAILALAGIAIGTGIALAAARLLASQLYGIAPTDAFTLAGAAALMLAVALGSGWWPARHAARTDPMRALRSE